MRLYVLDPIRFTSYRDEGLCPNCGHRDEAGALHMQELHINGLTTWGCHLPTDTPCVRPGMLFSK